MKKLLIAMVVMAAATTVLAQESPQRNLLIRPRPPARPRLSETTLSTQIVDGVAWTYSVNDGKAQIRQQRGSVRMGLWVPAISASTTGAITIPSTLGGCPVTSIENFALNGCSGLTSVTVPSSVTNIGFGTFLCCSGLKSFSVVSNNPSYSSVNGLLCSKDGKILIAGVNGEVVIPLGVTSIGRGAFRDCSGLTSVTIPSSVTNIGNGAFSGCSRLKSFSVASDNSSYSSVNGLLCSKDGKTLIAGLNGDLVIPSGITSVGRFAFYDCSGLTSVLIPSSVTNIEHGAFMFCDSLISVTIPSSVMSIGDMAFVNCCALKTVTISEGVTGIGSDAFSGVNMSILPGMAKRARSFVGFNGLTLVTIPSSVMSIGDMAFSGCGEIKSFSVASGNPSYVSINGLLYTKDGKTLIAGVNGDIVIPRGVTSIANGAFENRSGLMSVTIPPGVTNIGMRAYENCKGLTSVVIPESVTSIGKWAFLDCSGLTSVTIPSSVTNIGNGAFFGCSRLTSVNVVKDGKVEIVAFNDFKKHWEPPSSSALARQAARREGNRGSLRGLRNRQETLHKDRKARLKQVNGEKESSADAGSATTNNATSKLVQGKNMVAEKLQSCDFLLNKDFKKNAKVYLCLFSASWCGPCRREMPRIAQTYVDTLKDDPDIELIHFSRDRDDEKALAWAKEHDVKFPVVKPKGGNPLDLHTRGIPHLFIVKADGTLVEEGHPASLFTDEKLQELKDGRFSGKNGSTRSAAGDPSRACCRGSLLSGGMGSLRGRRRMREQQAEAVRVEAAEKAKREAAEQEARRAEEAKLRAAEREEQRKQLETLRKVREERMKRVNGEKESPANAGSTTNNATNKLVQGKNVVAEKIQGCDFLLNKDFKKNAKVYLCLFSASWCPPCRREMPRIAQVYVDTLKNDPDIELIHFSRDQDDEKAMAWAKEHDVKFPVVKPKGGNPLDLHTRGIPHLFIVKADGTLVEEGHPASLFTDEKLQELKDGGDTQIVKGTAEVDGYTWSYRAYGGEATIVSDVSDKRKKYCAVSPKPTGSITIPSELDGMKVTRIGKDAFAHCDGLTSVTIPDGVKIIGDSAFYYCKGLKTVAIPSSVTRIGDSAFLWCCALESLTMPEGVTSIGHNAFMWCGGLKTVKIPSSVKRIGPSAFSLCSGLMSFSVSLDNPSYCSRNGLLCSKDGLTLVAGVNGDVTIPDGMMRIGESAFYGCENLKTLMIPASLTNIARAAFFVCGGLTSIRVDDENRFYKSVNGLLLTKDGKTLIRGTGNGVVEIPSTVTSIGDMAFSGSSGLVEVTIPSGVTQIGRNAFSGCRELKSVTIPDGVTSIENAAFYGCRGLKSVTIPSGVTRIGHNAFTDCFGLELVTMRGERPDIGKYAFGFRKILRAIHVPANAKSWAGMKEWQGVPLVFDAEAEK